MSKPALFIGSSSEGLEIARAIEFQLQGVTEVTIWNEGFFGLGKGSLDTLVNSIERFDFAILVLTSDDLSVSRDVSYLCPRDNVIFELGLFMGRLGRARTLIVCDQNENFKIPSDLAGFTVARYDANRKDGNMIAALGPACTLIRNTIKDLGIFEGKSFQRLQKAADEVEGISDSVARLVYLLARSRAVELDVIAKQFGAYIPSEFLEKMIRDLKELEDSTKGQHNLK